MTDRPEVQILTVPKWFLPALLFITTVVFSLSIYLNSSSWSFGNIFGWGSVEAQSGGKVCGMNIDPVNPSGDPGGGTFSGVGWVRLVFKSNGGAPTLNSLADSFAFYDSRIDSYKAAGANVMLILNHETYWGCAPWNNSGCTDAYANEFADVVSQIATHYAGRVDAYEIWNEPDLEGSYVPPGVLGPIANKAVPAIRAADSSAYVVLGGFGSGASSILGYINSMGLSVSFDAVSGHPYGQGINGIGEQFGDINDYLNTLRGCGIPIWLTEIGLPCSPGDCEPPSDFMEAFYDNVSIPVIMWYGWSDGMKNGFGITDASQNIKEPLYSTFYQDACDTTVTLPQAGGGGIPQGAGTWNGPGGMREEFQPRCVASSLTNLEPQSREYSKQSEIQLSDGRGGVYGDISVVSVTVADLLQDQKVERSGDTVVLSEAAQSDKTWDYDLYYNVVPNYPADGRFDTYTKMAVLSWPNLNCVSNALDSSWIPIPTSWACTGVSEYSWANQVSPPTWYVEETPEEGAAYTRVSVPMYFPLGTALGAIPIDPYNHFFLPTLLKDFETEAEPFTGHFVREQSVRVDFMESVLDAMWDLLPEWMQSLLRALGIRALMDDKLDVTDVTSVKVDSGTLPMKYYYDADEQAGEQNIPLPDIDYYQNCDALWKVWEIDYPEKIERMRAKLSDCGSVDTDCLDAGGGLACYHTDNTCSKKWEGIISEAENKMDRLYELWQQCVGTGKRPMELIGHIDNVMAPFIQILAHRRLQQVILTEGGVLCDVPEENLFAAEVTLNVKWYDKNGSSAGGENYLTCPTGNILNNGSFEETWAGPVGGTASGALPAGWKALWKKNPESVCSNDNLYFCHAPEFTPRDISVDERRVLDGALSSLWFSAFNTHDVLMYQTVATPSGQLNLSGYGQTWRSSEGLTADGCAVSDLPLTGDGSFTQMCAVSGHIDIPSGFEILPAEYDSFISELESRGQCTAKQTHPDTWMSHFLSVNGGGEVTVFLRGYAEYPNTNTDDYWDNICLVPSGELVTESLGEILETPRRSATQSSDCTAVNLPEPDCTVSVEGPSGGAPILDEDLIFYMPGLGVIPYLDESINVGDAKSTNREASDDLPYCKNREVSDMPFGNPLFSELSALDVYIFQNLPPDLDVLWIKAIWPAITKDVLIALRDHSPIEEGPGYDWSPEETDCDGGNNQYERLIVNVCRREGLSSEQTAYVLATALGECSVTPISEYGCYSNGCDGSGVCNWMDGCGCEPLIDGNLRLYGCPDPVTGLQYYGRGFVQLTWKNNYINAGNQLGIDLVNHPERVLEPDIAAEIIVRGMKEGWFTGRRLSDYINESQVDYVNARRIVNGTSAAERFARMAICYFEYYPSL